MNFEAGGWGAGSRYQVDETPPVGLTLGLGLQLAVTLPLAVFASCSMR